MTDTAVRELLADLRALGPLSVTWALDTFDEETIRAAVTNRYATISINCPAPDGAGLDWALTRTTADDHRHNLILHLTAAGTAHLEEQP